MAPPFEWLVSQARRSILKNLVDLSTSNLSIITIQGPSCLHFLPVTIIQHRRANLVRDSLQAFKLHPAKSFYVSPGDDPSSALSLCTFLQGKVKYYPIMAGAGTKGQGRTTELAVSS